MTLDQIQAMVQSIRSEISGGFSRLEAVLGSPSPGAGSAGGNVDTGSVVRNLLGYDNAESPVQSTISSTLAGSNEGLKNIEFILAALRVDIRSAIQRMIGGGGGAGGGPAPGGGGGGGGGGGIGSLFDRIGKGATTAAAALGVFAMMFDKVISGMGQQMTKFVVLANPAAVFRFNIAVENAMSAVGRILLPMLERSTVLIQMMGNALESLSPVAKQAIAALAAGGGLVAAMAAIAVAGKLLIAVMGGWPALIIALIGALGGIIATTSEGSKIIGAMSGALKSLGNMFEALAQTVIPTLTAIAVPAFQLLGEVLKLVGNVIGQLLGALMPGVQAIAQVLGALMRVVSSLVAAIAPLISLLTAPISVVLGLLSAVVEALSSVLVPALNWFADTVGRVAKFIIGVVNTLLGLIGMEIEIGKYDPASRTAVAARQYQMGDLRSFANAAYTSALSSGAPSLAEKQLGATQQTNTILRGLPGAIAAAIRGGGSGGLKPSQQAALGLGDVGAWLGRRVGLEETGRTIGTAGGIVSGQFLDAARAVRQWMGKVLF